MDVHRVVCQVAEAVVVVIAGTERGRGCRVSFRLETPVKGGGAFTPSWGGSVVVSFGYLVHGDGGGAGEGVAEGDRLILKEQGGWSGRGGRGGVILTRSGRLGGRAAVGVYRWRRMVADVGTRGDARPLSLHGTVCVLVDGGGGGVGSGWGGGGCGNRLARDVSSLTL